MLPNARAVDDECADCNTDLPWGRTRLRVRLVEQRLRTAYWLRSRLSSLEQCELDRCRLTRPPSSITSYRQSTASALTLFAQRQEKHCKSSAPTILRGLLWHLAWPGVTVEKLTDRTRINSFRARCESVCAADDFVWVEFLIKQLKYSRCYLEPKIVFYYNENIP